MQSAREKIFCLAIKAIGDYIKRKRPCGPKSFLLNTALLLGGILKILINFLTQPIRLL